MYCLACVDPFDQMALFKQLDVISSTMSTHWQAGWLQPEVGHVPL
jgi:hypothetical protein